MQRFEEFVVNRAATLKTDKAQALPELWGAWATLYAPGADRPTEKEFTDLARRLAQRGFAQAVAVDRDAGPAATPLAPWRFTGQLRSYQADVLQRIPVVAGEPLHIVAPPGSGKTLLGLLLAVRRGTRVVALAPTATIRSQWVRSAAALDGAAGAVSQDPHQLGDVTALTYQLLSVLEGGSPLTELAVAEWIRELATGGRSDEAAELWIADLRETNAIAFHKGVARRSRAIRRRLAHEDPDVLAQALHPNALDLVERLVAHGVETIVLDECHHLLDHWALVVAYLAARIRQAGGTPLLIGLTATLPSTDDKDAYDNYMGLLGEVDYEVPTPAVVKEGNLAPYRDHVWFVEPTKGELLFLREHERRLADLIREVLAGDDGTAYLAALLQPADAAGASPEQRLARAFADDFTLAESAARMLSDLVPRHPLLSLLHDDARTPPDAEQRIRLLARYALDQILPDPARADQWQRIKSTVVDFGYTLTDRGVRRGRDPIDTLLASSAAKDTAVGEILRLELGQPTGQLVKAVVVADFAVHGNKHGDGGPPAGALRLFDTIVADPSLAALRPVLVTAQHLRIAARDAQLLVPAVSEELGIEITAAPIDGSMGVLQLDTAGRGSASIVAAVSALLTRGVVRVVVGTRGLLGEGWDCPAVNTLIDLTAVATSSATQQLRGRTLRLDPSWPQKVAHNWTVTAVVPANTALDAAPDVARMRRKHSRIWGLLREDGTQIVRGLPIALTDEQAGRLAALVHKDTKQTAAGLNASIVATLPGRADSYRAWRIGEPYADREGVAAVVQRTSSVPFRTGPTLEILLAAILAVVLAVVGESERMLLRLWADNVTMGIIGTVLAVGIGGWLAWPLVKQLRLAGRQLFSTTAAYRRVVRVVVDALHRAGHVPAFGEGDIRVAAGDRVGEIVSHFEMAVTGGSHADQRTVANAIAELFGPVRNPRFLLQVGRGEPGQIPRQPLLQLALWLARVVTRGERYLPVPALLGRRRADAEVFAGIWRRTIGACVLHEIDSPEDLVLLVRARREAAGSAEPPLVRENWS